MTAGLRAAAALGLSGPNALQAGQARAGLVVWASADAVDLDVEDDGGSAAGAEAAYLRFVDKGVDLMVGPYGSGMVRRVAPVVCGRGRLLWNHGGSADELARPRLVSVTAPASTYFHEVLRLVVDQQLKGVVLVPGRGAFARAVAEGAQRFAAAVGVPARVVGWGGWRAERSLAGLAVLFASTFDEDVKAVVELVGGGRDVGLVGCVAAGIDAFGTRLGELAEGVVGPAQWFPDDRLPEVGPSGRQFARRFEEATGEAPDYVAAQAAATGHLASEALQRGLRPAQVAAWRTSTMLGPFALDRGWRQAGYVPLAVRWEGGRRVRCRPCAA